MHDGPPTEHVVEMAGPQSLSQQAERDAASRISAASHHLHRHYRMRRKRRAARHRPPSGGPQFNVKTLAGQLLSLLQKTGQVLPRSTSEASRHVFSSGTGKITEWQIRCL